MKIFQIVEQGKPLGRIAEGEDLAADALPALARWRGVGVLIEAAGRFEPRLGRGVGEGLGGSVSQDARRRHDQSGVSRGECVQTSEDARLLDREHALAEAVMIATAALEGSVDEEFQELSSPSSNAHCWSPAGAGIDGFGGRLSRRKLTSSIRVKVSPPPPEAYSLFTRPMFGAYQSR
jgi:hypothetical protein